eukprot:CAMPEP_0181315140 /NCGR_PEP_ID=MMETSP1101-20121128/15206_1 /TAXON_ID=46948 /ORGANISM="Rhodomonas abbreviata, Strain Caron Lab Isolate" /LENGTH=191 /DNA_ID=CAMNT_0023422307 /DNA_START=450 /DNA_END=1021 /DNA_ORIENTATION=+
MTGDICNRRGPTLVMWLMLCLIQVCACAFDNVPAGGTAILPSNHMHGHSFVSRMVRVAESMFKSTRTDNSRREPTWEGSAPSVLSQGRRTSLTCTEKSGFVDVGRSETPHHIGRTGAVSRMPMNGWLHGRGKVSRNAGGGDIPSAELYVEGNPSRWDPLGEEVADGILFWRQEQQQQNMQQRNGYWRQVSR